MFQNEMVCKFEIFVIFKFEIFETDSFISFHNGNSMFEKKNHYYKIYIRNFVINRCLFLIIIYIKACSVSHVIKIPLLKKKREKYNVRNCLSDSTSIECKKKSLHKF